MNEQDGNLTTLLFAQATDNRQSPAAQKPMTEDWSRQQEILQQVIKDGEVFKVEGSSLWATFARTNAALTAALTAQRELNTWDGAKGVQSAACIALHCGPSERGDSDYYGPTIDYAARLVTVGYPGQVLLSQATATTMQNQLPLGASLRDLGRHRLTDLAVPQYIYQLVAPGLVADFPPLRTLESFPNNLPTQLTSFIGREREVIELKRMATLHRLLTLIGVGGAGKTRLSLQVAAELVDRYADGVWFIELAPINNPELVPKVVATALGVDEEAGHPISDTLLNYLNTKQALLVLDNCEHLLAAAAQLVNAIIETCPQVSILASSREPLKVQSEITWRVPSLPAPTPKYEQPIVQLRQYAAVRLFLDRVGAVQPSFRLSEQNAAAVAQICHRLDGIPLALELAAAKVLVLSPAVIATQLNRRFQLLNRGSLDAPSRQQTLRALVDWSYDLLNPQERELLMHLAVFAGSWDEEAAVAVASSEGVAADLVPELLDQLVSKSLVVSEEAEGKVCYSMLETIRQYAEEKLLALREGEILRQRHATYYLQLAETAESNLKGAGQSVWLKRLEQEHDNLRAVLRWAVMERQSSIALRMAGALARFWQYHGHLNEGWQWLEAALYSGHEGDDLIRAKALSGAGNVAWWRGDYSSARQLHQQSLELRQRVGDKAGIANSLINLGNLASALGDNQTSDVLYQESLSMFRELGDKWSIAQALNNLGNVANAGSGLARARAFFEEALSIYRELGDKWAMALALDNLGSLSFAMKEYEAASAIHKESLRLFREVEGKRGIAYALVGLGKVAIGRGGEQGARRAVRLLSAGGALFRSINAALDPDFRTEYEQELANSRILLDEATFEAMSKEGTKMELSEAVEYALTEV